MSQEERDVEPLPERATKADEGMGGFGFTVDEGRIFFLEFYECGSVLQI